jgi:hypothetical protein
MTSFGFKIKGVLGFLLKHTLSFFFAYGQKIDFFCANISQLVADASHFLCDTFKFLKNVNSNYGRWLCYVL